MFKDVCEEILMITSAIKDTDDIDNAEIYLEILIEYVKELEK